MEEFFARIFDNFVARLDGPLHFRFVFQPLMAIILATIDGSKDAKAGKTPYFWSLFGTVENRRTLLKEGWSRFGKVFVIAVILDVAYQIMVGIGFFPLEILLTATLLALLPYVFARGIANRIFRALRKTEETADTE